MLLEPLALELQRYPQPRIPKGVTVDLSSSQLEGIVLAKVVIPAGKTVGTFTTNTNVIRSKTTAKITASFNGATKSADLVIS